jgi:hypothetical protein
MTNSLPPNDPLGPGSAWPRTLQEAVDRLALTLSQAEKDDIATMPKGDLIDLHFGLDVRIREDFGLWRGNQVLMNACGFLNADDASMAIIRVLWARLRH